MCSETTGGALNCKHHRFPELRWTFAAWGVFSEFLGHPLSFFRFWSVFLIPSRSTQLPKPHLGLSESPSLVATCQGPEGLTAGTGNPSEIHLIQSYDFGPWLHDATCMKNLTSGRNQNKNHLHNTIVTYCNFVICFWFDLYPKQRVFQHSSFRRPNGCDHHSSSHRTHFLEVVHLLCTLRIHGGPLMGMFQSRWKHEKTLEKSGQISPSCRGKGNLQSLFWCFPSLSQTSATFCSPALTTFWACWIKMNQVNAKIAPSSFSKSMGRRLNRKCHQF